MDSQFSRTLLLLGEKGLSRLSGSRVAVVGCGAVGSYVAESLVRGGVGHIRLIDFDTVAVSNINRQLFALHSTIGRKKVDVAAERLKDINPNCQIEAVDALLDENNAELLLSGADFVADAIDDRQAKIAIYKECQRKNIPFISSMGAARRTDISQVHVDKMKNTKVCPLAADLRRMCKKNNLSMDFPVVYSTQNPVGQCAENRQMGSLPTVTGVFGLTVANYILLTLTQDNHLT